MASRDVVTQAVTEDAAGAGLRVLPQRERRQQMRGPDRRRAVQHRVNFAADYPAVNGVYAAHFKPGRFPARTTVGVTNLAMGALVEIDLIVQC